MISTVYSGGLFGIEAYIINVEVNVATGFPGISLVGLAEGAVKESKVRVESAIQQIDDKLLPKKITINLAPATLPKWSSALDLPIAIGMLIGHGVIRHPLDHHLLFGELSLDGKIKPVKGVLPVSIEAKNKNLKGVIIPKANANEGAAVQGIDIIPVETLGEVVEIMNHKKEMKPYVANSVTPSPSRNPQMDMQDIKGQSYAKRALEIAAAGGHNLIFLGPPGSGKTLLATRLPGILPDMSFQESLETTKIYSVAGLLNYNAMISQRPFRSPHHTVSDAGMIGGGKYLRCGEVTLAHNGVLFLDEFPEFRKNVLEVLRQPLEDKKISIARAESVMEFPANFMLVAAMNPCPCGYYLDPYHTCICPLAKIQSYRSKISGPLMDRIDIHVDVPPLTPKELFSTACGESSEKIRKRVNQARKLQQKRFQAENIFCNAQMSSAHIKRHCALSGKALQLLTTAVDRFLMSARSLDKIIKLARTIADLSGDMEMGENHIAEAIQYRALDKTIRG